MFLNISSCNAKILGETNFRTRDKSKRRRETLQGLRVIQAALTEKVEKSLENHFFFRRKIKCQNIGGNKFSHMGFPEVGQKQKTEREKNREKKTEGW